jgi:serine/threonine-protein kinase
MTLTSGTRLGPYEILSPLGAGGMGEVYRARDTRLGREVAIKSLPAELAQDAERLARFEREAKLLASLSHPNIAGIHGLEEVGGARYLVLELVEGETLAARLARGLLAQDDALNVCAQVATAVEAAHEAGIIHRDLKPGNVMIKPDGTVKVLDFGLAKSGAATAASSNPNLSASPTITQAATTAGVILGTAAYMSPEQARGRATDRRTDIWSFGCVLYECLVGRALFEGDTVSDLIAKILQTEPDWSALPVETPSRVRALLARCLNRDAKLRLRDIGEARIALSEVAMDPGVPVGNVAAASNRRGRRAIIMAGLVIASVLITVLAMRFLSRAPALPRVVLSVVLPKDQRLDAGPENDVLAVAPDGNAFVFAASTGTGNHRLYLRRFDRPENVELAGTDDAGNPFFSPDGEWVAFFANRHLLKTSVRGGTPVELAESGSYRGGTWLDDGSIVFTPTFASPLIRIPSNGGEGHAITTLDSTRSERTHRWPCGLPGSKWVVFTVGVTNSPGGYDDASIEAVSIQSGERRVLAHGGYARYAPGGRLIFARNGSLYAIPLDPDDPRGGATAVPVLDGVLGVKTSGVSFFDIAQSGTLVSVPGREAGAEARLVWRDLEGKATALPGEPRNYQFFDISPDGKSALAQIGAGGGDGNIFMIDLSRGTANQVTFSGHDGTPFWTMDGRDMVWSRVNNGRVEIAKRSVLGSDSALVLTRSNLPLIASDVLPDGSAVVYSEYGSVDADVWEVPIGGGMPRALVQEPRSQSRGVVSPDGQWIAYVSDESGAREVCVRPMGRSGSRTQVSENGGISPMWSPDSRTLYYLSGGGLVEAPLSLRGGALVADSTHYLFDVQLVNSDGSVQAVGIDRSGRRFLVRTPEGEPNELREISVRLDWAASLKTDAHEGQQ